MLMAALYLEVLIHTWGGVGEGTGKEERGKGWGEREGEESREGEEK